MVTVLLFWKNNMKFVLLDKDLHYDWFNGTGKGGQHRNKHQNCLRLTHIPTKIQVTAQRQRDRPSNESDAIEKLTKRVKSFLHPEVQKLRFKATEEIRVYKESMDMVKDHASGETVSYRDVVINANSKELNKLIQARKKSVEANDSMSL